MILNSKNINKIALSVWMGVILLIPLIVESHHHHSTILCNDKNIQHFHTLPETCYICDFDFSIFSESSHEATACKPEFSDYYVEICKSSIRFQKAEYSFLLRAPPAFAN